MRKLTRKRTGRTLKPGSGCSSARLERLVWGQEADGSNPPTPTIQFGAMSAGVCRRQLLGDSVELLADTAGGTLQEPC